MAVSILFWQWHSFMGKGIEKALHKLDIAYDTFFYQLSDWEADEGFSEQLQARLKKKKYDAVFSVNYTPLITEVCDRIGIPYIAWVYDSPIHIRAIEPLKKECNHIYFFDRGQVEEYNRHGIAAKYMPLAADTAVFAEYCKGVTEQTQVAMVGQLYQNDYAYYMTPLENRIKGYFEGILASQMKLYGAYILPELITEEILDKVNAQYAKASGGTVSIQKRELEYMLACEVTGRERRSILQSLAGYFDVKLYSGGEVQAIEGVTHLGYVDYYTKMPQIFAGTKVNLNISLKTIRTGIPLRVLDVLSCGGFLISNYQSELAEYFDIGEELVVYQDMEEVPLLVQYYLEHEEERKRIAEKGKQRIERDFRFEDRISRMLEESICNVS